MNVRLLPGLTIGKPPPELRLGNGAEPWRSRDYAIYNDDRDRQDILHEATAFPAAVTAGTPAELMAKLFACSGAVMPRTRSSCGSRPCHVPKFGSDRPGPAASRRQSS